MALYTQEQLEKANNIDLEEFLTRRGAKLRRTGKESRFYYRDSGGEHDSVSVSGNRASVGDVELAHDATFNLTGTNCTVGALTVDRSWRTANMMGLPLTAERKDDGIRRIAKYLLDEAEMPYYKK